MKKILFATDYSFNANKAFQYGLALSKATGAKLVLFHAYRAFSKNPDSETDPTLKFMDDHLKAGERDKLREFYLKPLAENTDHIECGACPLNDRNPHDCIVDYAEEIGADLILVGARGENKLSEILWGGTPVGLLHHAKCPVLVVPKAAVFKDIHKIFYATDLEKSDIKAIDDTAILANMLDAEMILGHVSRPKDTDDRQEWNDFQEIVKSFISYENLSFELWIWDDILDNLELYVKEKEIDLLVMMERDRPTLFAEVFERDVVEEMALHGTVPVLVYNPHFLGEEGEKVEEGEIYIEGR